MKRIAITIGDPNGIGPEVALKAVARRWPAELRFVLVGCERLIREQARAMGLAVPRRLEFMDAGVRAAWHPGSIRADASRLAAAAILRAVDGCLAGEFDAMVTAPICKEGFHKAGIEVPGHTELLAERTGSRRFAMLLAGGGLRVVLATRHLPLSQVAGALTKRKIQEQIALTGEALRLFGIDEPRIAVCGLNPHAGDGGVLGREEIETINPAVRAARKEGWNAIGAVPADTVFHEALAGQYDAVVAMYHDQGLGPLKMLGFDEGVNVTLGLPIIRTSPDHGTAFGLAGKNSASSKSMEKAISLAADMAGRPNPWRHHV